LHMYICRTLHDQRPVPLHDIALSLYESTNILECFHPISEAILRRNFTMSFQKELSSQSWTLYGIGMFLICLRTYVHSYSLDALRLQCLTSSTRYARWRRVRSLSQFAIDDWLMLTAIPLFYTGLVVCLNIIASGGGSNLFPPEQFASMSQAEIKERIKGSKIVIVSEHVCCPTNK
jgi:hypothetical protein